MDLEFEDDGQDDDLEITEEMLRAQANKGSGEGLKSSTLDVSHLTDEERAEIKEEA